MSVWSYWRHFGASASSVFSDIYRRNEWQYGSGEGSRPEVAEPYRAFLQQFLRERGITSVVDAGCGDWQFSRAVDWSGIDYLGLDVVPAVLARNSREFGNEHIHFRQLDVMRNEPPRADLLILKDVMQHWSFRNIRRALQGFRKHDALLITNDEPAGEQIDIRLGGYRPLDLRKPPFNLPATEVFRWSGIFAGTNNPWTKVTLLLRGADLGA